MLNYIKADLYRISLRVPRWIVFGVILLVGLLIFTGQGAKNMTATDAVEMYTSMMGMVSMIIAITELVVVFGDDLAAKAMQTAIGRGMSRPKVVLVKWLEMIGLCLVDFLFYAVLLVIVTALHGHFIIGNSLAMSGLLAAVLL